MTENTRKNSSPPVLEVKNLKKTVNGFVLDVPDLSFPKGKIYSVTGQNGSGKTTLISILNLLEEPDEGRLFFCGAAIPADETSRTEIRRRMVMVLEDPYMFNTTVLRNVAYGLKARGIYKKKAERPALDALERVGLGGFARRKARELSRGETQRVAIARAIVLEPDVLFLDEPFTNIDKRYVDLLERVVLDINRRFNTTIIFTTHDLFQAYRLSDEILSLIRGRPVKGSIDNLLTGHIVEEKNTRYLVVSPELRIAVVTDRDGEANALIPPEDIILSKEPFRSSARNVLRGVINRMEMDGETVRVCCDAGVEFISLITRKSFEKMELSIGSRLYLTFKTTSVKIF